MYLISLVAIAINLDFFFLDMLMYPVAKAASGLKNRIVAGSKNPILPDFT